MKSHELFVQNYFSKKFLDYSRKIPLQNLSILFLDKQQSPVNHCELLSTNNTQCLKL